MENMRVKYATKYAILSTNTRGELNYVSKNLVNIYKKNLMHLRKT